MIGRLMRRAAIATLALLLAVAGSVVTAANTVPATNVGSVTQTIGPNDLKPSACSGLTLTNLVTGSGTFSGTSGADLMLGGAGLDAISGGNQTDCILGGGGNDTLTGGNASDVCIGGPDTDLFVQCEAQIQ